MSSYFTPLSNVFCFIVLIGPCKLFKLLLQWSGRWINHIGTSQDFPNHHCWWSHFPQEKSWTLCVSKWLTDCISQVGFSFPARIGVHTPWTQQFLDSFDCLINICCINKSNELKRSQPVREKCRNQWFRILSIILPS